MAKFNKTRFFQVKPAIYYGMNSMDELSKMGLKQVCIVTDKGMVEFGILKKLTDILDKYGINYHVFDEVQPDPTMDIVESGLVSLILEKPEALIGLGGGSAIDSAKAIIYYGNRFHETIFGESIYKKPFFIALPTTAGTGSEVTNYAVITDTNTGTKIPLTSDDMMPDVAILEPRLIESVPPAATAATGLDVLTHAIEAYSSTDNNPFARCYAAKAAELVFKNLPACFEDGHDLNAKASMQIASCMAGIAFNSAGLGITHSLAHAIGAEWHLPHGLANALVLPYVISFNGEDEYTASVYNRLLSAMNLKEAFTGEAVKILHDEVIALKEKLNLPMTLKELGVEEDDFLGAAPGIVKKAMADVCTKTNPISPSVEDLTRLLFKVYYGE